MEKITKRISPAFFKSVLLSSFRLGATRFTLWFYPSTTEKEKLRIINRFQGCMLKREAIEPVTLYFDVGDSEGTPVETAPITFRLDPDSIEKLTKHLKKLIRTCDDVATYTDIDSSFRCAVIFHERMVLLREED